MIACVLIPDLVMLVERQQDPTLSDLRPILLLNASGKVQAASLDAARREVRLGMRLRQAQALCADVVALPFNPTPYQETATALVECLSHFTNRVEIAPGFWGRRKKRGLNISASAGVLYLDLGKLRDPAEVLTLAQQMSAALRDTFGVAPHIGLASSKFTAAAAVRFASPHQPNLVAAGEEALFLSSLPVSLLPLDAEILRRLKVLGLQTLGQLAELPPGALASQFGKTGRLIAQLACGQDARPVPALAPQPAEHLCLRLHGAVEDHLTLQTVLEMLGCDLEARLQARSFTAQSLQLVLHLDNGSIQNENLTLRKATDDGQRLGRALVQLLARLKLSCGVVAIEVHADDLKTVEWRQLDLFGHEFSTQDKLRQLVESLTLRFGEDRFYHIRLVDPDNRLVERRFQIERVDAA